MNLKAVTPKAARRGLGVRNPQCSCSGFEVSLRRGKEADSGSGKGKKLTRENSLSVLCHNPIIHNQKASKRKPKPTETASLFHNKQRTR